MELTNRQIRRAYAALQRIDREAADEHGTRMPGFLDGNVRAKYRALKLKRALEDHHAAIEAAFYALGDEHNVQSEGMSPAYRIAEHDLLSESQEVAEIDGVLQASVIGADMLGAIPMEILDGLGPLFEWDVNEDGGSPDGAKNRRERRAG